MTSELTPAWRALMQHADAMRDFRVADAFRADPNRAERFSMRAAGLFVDFSKQRISVETMTHLHALADAAAVVAQRDAMAAGEHINRSEQRAVKQSSELFTRGFRDEHAVMAGGQVTQLTGGRN